VRWLLGCQWWWRCRRRSHRTGESDRASALTRLAPDLSADLLGQALAAAASDDTARAKALTRLAPHLPSTNGPPC
jgi:hypothetical protein